MPFFRKRSKNPKAGAAPVSQNDGENMDELLSLIVPILKPQKSPMKTITVNGETHELPKGSMPVSTSLDFDELHFVFGIDREVSYEWLQNKQIEDWTSEQKNQLVNSAFTNWFRGSDLGISMISDDIGMIVGGQGLESNVFMISSVWDAIYQQLGSEDVVFAIPAQDVFIFTKADNPESVDILREKAGTLFNSEDTRKPISGKLYRQVGGETVIYTP